MKYKMICIDMDGTLLNNKKEVTEKTKQAVKDAQDAGVKIVICTGRLFTSADYYADIIGIKAPIISANGAYIRSKDDNEVIYKSILGKENSNIILGILRKNNITPNFHTPDGIFTEGENDNYNMYVNNNKSLPEDKKLKIEIVKDWTEVFNRNEDNILKCIAIDKDIEKIQKAKREILKYDELEVVSSWINNFEIMSKGVSKGRGVEILAAYYGIDREDIICIGDNENDLSMIKYAGLGVCMANGEEQVKRSAQYVTSSNNDDGVAEVIERFILKE